MQTAQTINISTLSFVNFDISIEVEIDSQDLCQLKFLQSGSSHHMQAASANQHGNLHVTLTLGSAHVNPALVK